MSKLILIDNGHGLNTPGKRSPDGVLLEWDYTRRVAARVASILNGLGIEARLLVPEPHDVPLPERVARANALNPALLVSMHLNASGMGQSWNAPQGWSAYVAPAASKQSQRAATALAEAARKHGLLVRVPCPAEPFWRQSLAMVRSPRCPAVLTENLFMDNSADCAFLLSPEGFDTIVDVHVAGISAYLAS